MNYMQNFLANKRKEEQKKAETKAFVENMYEEPETIPGSTLTPTTASTHNLYVNNSLTFLNNKEQPNVAEGITHDYLTNSNRLLPSSAALYKALVQLRTEIEAIDPNNNFLQDNTVITLPLTPFYKTDLWSLTDDWQFFSQKAIYISTGNEKNYIEIKNAAIEKEGYYIFDIDVAEISSGVIDIKDFKGELVGTITKTGETVYETYVANTELAFFRISARETYPGDRIIINRVGFHHITDRFKDYMDYKFRTLWPFGEGHLGLTEELVAKISGDVIETKAREIYEDLNKLNSSLTSYIDTHKSDFDNPHKVTCSQINAARSDHSHVEFLEFPKIRQELDTLNLHANDTNSNPHKVTYKMVGAAPLEHDHDKLYAPIQHEHEQYTTRPVVTEMITQGVKDYLESIPDEDTNSFIKHVFPYAYLLTNPKYTGNLPYSLSSISITKPSNVIITPFIEHDTKNGYSYSDGLSSCNILTEDTHPIQYAFKHQLNMNDFNVNVAAFVSTIYPIIEPVAINYEFNTIRKIKGYRVYKDATNKVDGFPVEWDFYADNRKINSEYDTAWTTRDSGLGIKYISFDEPVALRKFTLLIKQIDANYNDMLGLYKWGIRVEFDFADVNKNEVSIPYPVTSIFSVTNKFDIENLTAQVDIREDNSPVYLFLKMTKHINDKNEMEYIPSLITSGIRPEFSSERTGTPLFLDKFKEKENSVYGDLQVTNEDLFHPVQRIYSSKGYFSTKENSTFVSITHDFKEPLDIVGHEFNFSAKHAKDTPDSWIITYTFKDGRTVSLITEKYMFQNNPYGDVNVVSSKYDEILKDVVRYKLDLFSTDSESKIVVSKFMPMVAGWWCNPYENTSTDPFISPIGKVTYIRSAIDNNHTYKADSIPCSKSIRIPINDYNTVYKQGDMEIDNPYFTKDVSVIPIGDGLKVKTITDEKIIVYNVTQGKFAVEITRLF